MPTVPVITRREGLDTDRGGAPRARVDAGAMMVADAVQGISDAAMGIATRLHNRQQEKALQGEAVKLQQFKLDSEQLLESEASNISADGSEFFRNVDKKYAQLVENYRNSLSPEAAERFGPRYDLVTDDVLNRAAQTEAEQGRTYARDQIGKAHEAKLIALQRSPELVEQIQKNGMIDIDELGATLPEAERESLKEAWSANATYASELAKVESDPEYGQRYSAPREQYYAAIRAAESGGNDNAKNPNSSATGRYQFTEGTWEDLRTRFPGAGLTADGRTDPQQQETAIRLFTAQNERLLANSGITPTNGNLYAAHFLGAGDAVKVLNADQDAKLNDLLSDEVLNANPFLKGKSVWQFRSWAEKKAGGGDIPEGMTLKQYNDLRTKAVASTTAAKAQREDFYDLALAQNEISDPQVFLQDSLLDDGQRASLYRKWDAANKDRALVGAILAGGKPNPFDTDQRRAGNKAYDTLINSASSPEEAAKIGYSFVEEKNFVPDSLVSDIRQGLHSNNVSEVAAALEKSAITRDIAPVGLEAVEGGSQIKEAAVTYRELVNRGLSAEDAAQRYMDMNSPEAIAKRKQLKEPAADFLDTLNVSQVTNHFDTYFDWEPTTGMTPAMEAELMADYSKIAEESFYKASGDPELAKALALEEMSKIYGVTRINGTGEKEMFGAGVRRVVLGPSLMKYPPENFYPAIEGGHDYVAAEALKDAATMNDGKPVGGIMLEWTRETVDDIRAGRPPRYQLRYQDENGVWQEKLDMLFEVPAETINFYQAADRGKRGMEAERQRNIAIQERQKQEFSDQRQEEAGDFLRGYPMPETE